MTEKSSDPPPEKTDDDAETGELAATSEKVTVYFDLEARRSVSLPADLREAMAAHLVGE